MRSKCILCGDGKYWLELPKIFVPFFFLQFVLYIVLQYYVFRATPMGVVIWGVILITAKMTPERPKIRLKWK